MSFDVKIGVVLLFILLSMSVHAQNISVEYPSEISVEEEFEIKVILINFSESMYDLKFDIKNGNKNLAHVQVDDDWKSTHYWIKEAFVNESSRKFQVKITEPYEGTVPLIVKLREGTHVETFEGNELVIHNQEPEEDEEKNEEKEESGIELDWDEDEIINGEEFEIAINGFIPGDDIRLWIEKRGEIISERYDTKNEEWKSGLFYVNGFDDESIEIRIKNEYFDFDGEAVINAKIRDGKEENKPIRILQKEIVGDEQVEPQPAEDMPNSEEDGFNEAVIQLGTGKVVEEDSLKNEYYSEAVIYESRNEKMKRYALFGFALLCVGLCVLIAWGKIG